MKIAAIIIRTLLGLMFVVFGSNAFLHFIPVPPMQGLPVEFMHVMAGTGYMKAIAAFEIAGGLLLLVGRYIPLGLTLLGPVIVNIVFYHVFVDTSGLGIAFVVAVLALFLLWCHRANFAGLVKP